LVKADRIIVREQSSFQQVQEFLKHRDVDFDQKKLQKHGDFSKKVLQQAQENFQSSSSKKNTERLQKAQELISSLRNKSSKPKDSGYMLININQRAYEQ